MITPLNILNSYQKVIEGLANEIELLKKENDKLKCSDNKDLQKALTYFRNPWIGLISPENENLKIVIEGAKKYLQKESS